MNPSMPRIRISSRRRVALVCALTAAVAVVTAPPAAADPARPTNYRSEVTEITPPGAAVDARVVGGDAFLELAVGEGSQMMVFGYGGEPYLRFDPDGRVFVNLRSPAHYLNDDRFGQSEVPPSASVDADPQWELLAEGGRYGWHDHRIHWMAPAPPPGISRQEISKVLDWTVPVELDGEPVTIAGTLDWVPAISPVPWIGLAVAMGLGLIGVSRRTRFGVAVVSIVGATAALVVGGAEVAASPLGASGEILALGPPTLALALGILAFLHPRATVPAVVTAVMLGVWAVLRRAVLWMPELPSGLPPPLERGGVALAIGAAVALVYATTQIVSQPRQPSTNGPTKGGI
jgi:hypothetical protein